MVENDPRVLEQKYILSDFKAALGDKAVVTLITSRFMIDHIDGLLQERRNSIANALELRRSGTNPSICGIAHQMNIFSVFIRNHGIQYFLKPHVWNSDKHIVHYNLQRM